MLEGLSLDWILSGAPLTLSLVVQSVPFQPHTALHCNCCATVSFSTFLESFKLKKKFSISLPKPATTVQKVQWEKPNLIPTRECNASITKNYFPDSDVSRNKSKPVSLKLAVAFIKTGFTSRRWNQTFQRCKTTTTTMAMETIGHVTCRFFSFVPSV